MYFENRLEAGERLGDLLVGDYRYENCAVMALSEGGVLVAEPVAAKLHCIMTMIVTEDIDIPGEGLSFGGVSSNGNFTYNSDFSTGEAQEYTNEFHGYLEEQKREAYQRINRQLDKDSLIDVRTLHGRTIILVTDGMYNAGVLDVVLDFLKPVKYEKLVLAAPVASIPAIDKARSVVDDVQVLDMKENFMDTNHYYNDNTVPSRAEAIARIDQIIAKWR